MQEYLLWSILQEKLFPSMIQNEEEPQNRTDGELSKLSCYEVQNSFSLI